MLVAPPRVPAHFSPRPLLLAALALASSSLPLQALVLPTQQATWALEHLQHLGSSLPLVNSLQCLVHSHPLGLEWRLLLPLSHLGSQMQLPLLPLDKLPLLLHQHLVEHLARQLRMGLQQAPAMHQLPGESSFAAPEDDYNYCISVL